MRNQRHGRMRDAMFAPVQNDFAEALFDPERAVPEDILACHAEAAGKRFAVYRNNVIVSLLDALAARFKVTQQIAGDAFFKAMARMFIAAHPPTSPLMMFYGEAFPDFISTFAPAAEIPYLADIARLEAARTRAYHAADAAPLDPAALQSVTPDDLPYLHFHLHPSLEIVSSAYPVVTIWAMHEGLIPLGPITDWHGEDALVVRPHLDVDIRRLPPGAAAFLQRLSEGKSLAEAAECAAANHQDFDLAIHLAGLFSTGLVTALSIAASEDMPK